MPDHEDKATPLKAMRLCPICGKPEEAAYRPFCSRRCADVDLHRWLNGAYRVPAPPDDDEDAKPPRDASAPEPE